MKWQPPLTPLLDEGSGLNNQLGLRNAESLSLMLAVFGGKGER